MLQSKIDELRLIAMAHGLNYILLRTLTEMLSTAKQLAITYKEIYMIVLITNEIKHKGSIESQYYLST